ncbi:aldo/keto reductase [Promicromonospora sp. Populi]|uniref:aldo/keto reductase n=1 Tax=Promicromonospora sp. Populi TaxID=3239420 RepID=UPI0034E1DA04
MTLPKTTRRTIELGRIAFGAATLGNLHQEMSDESAHEILQTAWDLGIRHFDTAPHYGLGLSERRLGAFLRTRPRDEYVLSTKAGRLLRPNPAGAGTLDLEQGFAVPADLQRVPDFSADGVRRSLEESLDRLGLDRVDVLYLHDPERYGLADALATGVPGAAALRDEGLVRAIGVGSMSTPALLDAVRTGALDLLMVAGRYTLVEQPVRPEVLDACAEHGVGIVAASVFNSGLLARQDPAGGRYDYGAVPPDVLRRAQAIARVCAQHGTTLPAAALQYPLRDPLVRAVVVGAEQPGQVRENTERLAEALPEALWEQLQDDGLLPA